MPPVTPAALLALAALHGAWGLGSTVPFRDAGELADAVVGRSPRREGAGVPGPAACFAAAGALATAASLVADRPAWPVPLRRLGLAVLSGTLAVRGALGLAGRTDLLSPGSTSARFRRNDRRLYAPLWLALAAGAAASARS